jgi:hypothetical protein
MSAYDRQIENRNFYHLVGFKFTLNRAPKVAFFANSANIPSIKLVLQINQIFKRY